MWPRKSATRPRCATSASVAKPSIATAAFTRRPPAQPRRRRARRRGTRARACRCCAAAPRGVPATAAPSTRNTIRSAIRSDDARWCEVIDQGEAEPLVQVDEQRLDAAHVDRIEARERLVAEHDLGVRHDRARERRAPHHAARELARIEVLGVGQPDRDQPPGHLRRDVVLGELACARAAAAPRSRRSSSSRAARRPGRACRCARARGTARARRGCVTSSSAT